MRTVVVGGGGFVGLNIVERFLTQGRAVTLFDLTPPPEAALAAFEALPGDLRVCIGDVRNAGDLSDAFADADAVVYGAAVTAGDGRDREAPEVTLGVNLDGFLNALRVARDKAVRRVVNLSSAGAYGAAAFQGTGLLHEEDTPADPRNIYGITKFASERVGSRMADMWDLDVVNVRLSGVFGRWERRTSVRDTPSPQFQVLEALSRGIPAIVERLDARDWIYAPDVAQAVDTLLAASALRHRLYNVSTGDTWSVLDWGQAMAQRFEGGQCRLASPEEPANVFLHAASDRRALSVDRLRKDGVFPTCCNIGQSVENYYAWHQSLGATYK